MQQVCARAVHMWEALAIFSLTVKLFYSPVSQQPVKPTRMKKERKRIKQKKKCKNPETSGTQPAQPHNSGEMRNLPWPLEVFRLEWNAKTERTLQSFTAAQLELLLCSFLSSVSHLTHVLAEAQYFFIWYCRKPFRFKFYLQLCHEQELTCFLLCLPSKKWSSSFIFADIPEERGSSFFFWWSQAPPTSGVPAIT